MLAASVATRQTFPALRYDVAIPLASTTLRRICRPEEHVCACVSVCVCVCVCASRASSALIFHRSRLSFFFLVVALQIDRLLRGINRFSFAIHFSLLYFFFFFFLYSSLWRLRSSLGIFKIFLGYFRFFLRLFEIFFNWQDFANKETVRTFLLGISEIFLGYVTRLSR